MSKVEIYLDNYNGVCYPSQTISGRVECFFDKEKIVRAVRIKFKGVAKTEWTRRQGKRTVTYTGKDVYFDEEYNLVTGGEEFTLHAGKHTYPFSYILPPQLPSSFEGKYGNIQYTIKATVDRPWKFDYEEKASLNVVSPLDLNYLPDLRQPISVSADKEVSGCCFNAGGSVTFKISLPVRGYTPGEKLNIGAYVQNMCNENVERVEFKINQGIQWITNNPYTSERNKDDTIATCTEDGVGAHGEKSWTSTIIIPTEGFPNVTLCNIINITYRLEILCATNIEKYSWIPTKNEETHLLSNCHLVVGGSEVGHSLNIGRVNHDGEIIIGKVFSNPLSNRGLWIPYTGHETRFVSYEILTYNNC